MMIFPFTLPSSAIDKILKCLRFQILTQKSVTSSERANANEVQGWATSRPGGRSWRNLRVSQQTKRDASASGANVDLSVSGAHFPCPRTMTLEEDRLFLEKPSQS